MPMSLIATKLVKQIRSQKLTPVITLMILVFILSTIRLSQTTEFASDFSRDTLKALRLWQNKEITFLGSPIAFANLPGKTVFFSSLSLYLGMVGLVLTNFNPTGAVLVNVILTTISVYCFYLLAVRVSSSRSHALFATSLYALSPVTIAYSRFFWTPNTLIPLSVFFWYLATSKERRKQLVAGFVAGLMFLIHYMVVIPLSLYLLVLLLKKRYQLFLNLFIGIFLGTLSFFIFEFRNHFFLINSLIANLQSGSVGTGTFDQGNLVYRATLFFTTLFGFHSAEISFPTLISSSHISDLAGLVILVLIIREFIVTLRKPKSSIFSLTILLTLLITLLTKNAINIRYQFFLYPLIVLFAGSMLLRIKSQVLSAIFFIIMVGTSLLIISRTQQLTTYAIPLSTLEEISEVITNDDFQGTYNVTENVTKEAQAIAIRYFLLRDAGNKPQDELNYQHLDALYVVARNEQDIYEGGRWEFLATPNLTLTYTWPLDGLNVYKFQRKD